MARLDLYAPLFLRFVIFRSDATVILILESLFKDFSSAMEKIYSSPMVAARMGNIGRHHVKTNFSLEKFGTELHFHINDLLTNDDHTPEDNKYSSCFLPSMILAAVLCILAVSLGYDQVRITRNLRYSLLFVIFAVVTRVFPRADALYRQVGIVYHTETDLRTGT